MTLNTKNPVGANLSLPVRQAINSPSQNLGLVSATKLGKTGVQQGLPANISAGTAGATLGGVSNFVITIDNSAGVADKWFILADPSGVLAYNSNIPSGDFIATNLLDVLDYGWAAWKSLMTSNSFQIQQFQMQTSSDPAQFQMPLKQVAWDFGAYHQRSIAPDIFFAQNNMAQNPLILPINFPVPVFINETNGILGKIKAGETLIIGTGVTEAVIQK